jgi:hypothetical protein
MSKYYVPSIHDISQLHTVLVFSENKTEFEQWAKDWYKIKDFFTEISPISEALQKKEAQQPKKSAISMN